MWNLQELSDSLVRNIVEKLEQQPVVSLYRTCKWGSQMAQKHRQSVLDNYTLLINLVKKRDSLLSQKKYKGHVESRIQQLVGYMKRSRTFPTEPSPRTLGMKSVSFGGCQYRQIKLVASEIEDDDDKENIGDIMEQFSIQDTIIVEKK